MSRCLGAAGIDANPDESLLTAPSAVQGIIDKELLMTGIRYASMAYFGHLALMMLIVYRNFDGQVGAEAGLNVFGYPIGTRLVAFSRPNHAQINPAASIDTADDEVE